MGTQLSFTQLRGAAVNVLDRMTSAQELDVTGRTGTEVVSGVFTSLFNSLTGGEVITLAPGDYNFNASSGIGDAGVELSGVHDVTIIGYGARIYRSDASGNSNKKPFTFTGCDRLKLVGMDIDNAGSLFFGGLTTYDCDDLEITSVRFYDSAPGAETSDRFGLVISDDGGGGCNGVRVSSCIFDGLQTDAYGTDITFIGNHFRNNVNRALGLVTGGSSKQRLSYSVVGNTFRNQNDDCISIGTDPTSNSNSEVGNITVQGNTYYSSEASGGHFVGVSAIDNTNLIRNCTINGNTMWDTVGNNFIKIDSSNTSTYGRGFNISGNNYYSTAGTVAGPVINIRRCQESQVCNNGVWGAGITDAFAFTSFIRMTITGNQAEASNIAYDFNSIVSSSTGYNVIKNNTWMGSPVTPYRFQTGTNATDIVERSDADIATFVISGSNQSIAVPGIKSLEISAGAAASLSSASAAHTGQRLVIFFVDANVTINHGTSANQFKLSGGANFTGGIDDTLELIYDSTGKWKEISRTVI